MYLNITEQLFVPERHIALVTYEESEKSYVFVFLADTVRIPSDTDPKNTEMVTLNWIRVKEADVPYKTRRHVRNLK